MDYSPQIWQYGSEAPLPQGRQLQAGPLSAYYENGFLRYIRIGDAEVLRMLYFAVRDHNWDTMPGQISEESVELGESHFSIRYVWTSTTTVAPFRWLCRIEGTSDGKIEMEIQGEALGAFRRNRVGFCVLHPVKECAGKSCRLEHADGTFSDAQFPQYISPHQPMKSLRAMRWWPAPDCEAHLLMEGDVFEMEDQRNWTDDSYKTYCTPLGLPFPVQLEEGEKVWQKLSLSCTVEGRFSQNPEDLVRLHLNRAQGIPHLPRIGIERSSEHPQLLPEDAAQLSRIGFDHLRVEVHFDQDDWQTQLQQDIEASNRLNLPVEWVLFSGENPKNNIQKFAATVAEADINSASCLLLDARYKTTPQNLIEAVLPILRRRLPGIPVGAGTNAYFTELNRERISPDLLDFLSYSVNPQVHAFDNKSLTETLAAQAYTVESAQQFAGGKNLHISPITLKPRFNPNATGPPAPTAPGQLPDTVDCRQMSLYGAGWTLGSLAHLVFSGINTLTYYETTGWRGLMQGIRKAEEPLFPREVSMYYPVWQVFRLVLRHKSAQWIPVESSQSLRVKALAFESANKLNLLMANLSEETMSVYFDAQGSSARTSILDTSRAAAASKEEDYWATAPSLPLESANGQWTLSLPAFALAWVQIT